MGSFKIEGGQPLSEKLNHKGLRTKTLQILCAVLLTADPVIIHNIPEIIDVQKADSAFEKIRCQS